MPDSDSPFPTATFTAMTVEVTIIGSGVRPEEVADAAARGRALAETWEQEFSRFRPESTLSRLNAANGEAIPASPAFLAVLTAAQEGVTASGGRFDPGVLTALEAAGYDRTFAAIDVEVKDRPASSRTTQRAGSGWHAVRIDHAAGMVALPVGMRIDLGGIAKGAFVDALADLLTAWPGGMVDAGGDLRVWGSAPDGGPWLIAIEHPGRLGEDLATAAIADPVRAGGIATSGTNRRRWATASGTAHHLIDPATGLPAAGRGVSATAFAPTCVQAEIATKTLLIGGTAEAAAGLSQLARGVLLDGDGRVVLDVGLDRAAVRIS